MQSNRICLLTILAAASMAVQSASAGSLKFAADVPQAPTELPVLKLKAQPAPIDLMNQLLTTAGGAKLTPLGETPFFRKNQIKVPPDVVGIVEKEAVKAWADKRSGDAAIYPTLGNLKPIAPADMEKLASRTREIFASPQFIGHDDTRFVIDKPQILNGATLVRDATGAATTEKAAAQYGAYISARRYVGDLPVDGPGSRALLTIGDGGSVEGLTRVWKTANTVEKVRTSLSAAQVRDEITRQLKPA